MTMNVAATAITLAGVIIIPCFASDAPEINVAEIASYRTKIKSDRSNLFSVTKSSRSLEERDVIREIVTTAVEIESAIANLENLLHIKSFMHDEADKQVVSEFITSDIKGDVTDITLAIETVDRNIAYLKSPAAVTEANKLKNDLRGLKELLQP